MAVKPCVACRRLRIRDLHARGSFAATALDGLHHRVATPLFAIRIAALLDEEVLERPKQVGTKASLGGIDLADAGTGEHLGEKGLRQFRALVLAAALTSQKAEDRIPVGFAQIAQGSPGLGRLALGPTDHGPTRGEEHRRPTG